MAFTGCRTAGGSPGGTEPQLAAGCVQARRLRPTVLQAEGEFWLYLGVNGLLITYIGWLAGEVGTFVGESATELMKVSSQRPPFAACGDDVLLEGLRTLEHPCRSSIDCPRYSGQPMLSNRQHPMASARSRTTKCLPSVLSQRACMMQRACPLALLSRPSSIGRVLRKPPEVRRYVSLTSNRGLAQPHEWIRT